jgi:hypothetical protein
MIIGDIIFTLIFIWLYAVSLYVQLTNSDEYEIIAMYYGIYWTLSGGVTMILLILKSYYGSRFLYYSSHFYKKKI